MFRVSGDPEPRSSGQECISWRDTTVVYQPQPRSLCDFLSAVETISPPAYEALRRHSLLVFIEEHCLEQMRSHTAGNTRAEQAGILSGSVYLHGERSYLVTVESALPAETLADASYFRFREDAWDKIWAALPEATALLGWYHSHPGLGVFMSATDHRTQQRHFGAPWQLAVVLDPISQAIKVFAGRSGRELPEPHVLIFREKAGFPAGCKRQSSR
jgi:proteasome lid subunit RPN8/RPN11